MVTPPSPHDPTSLVERLARLETARSYEQMMRDRAELALTRELTGINQRLAEIEAAHYTSRVLQGSDWIKVALAILLPGAVLVATGSL